MSWRTTNQDLKSANEELQSTNEEMQSTNEELETSKEELQSINEELSTINAELQNKNEELSGVNNDIYNLLASTEIGTIFLDLDLHIRRFTPASQPHLQLPPRRYRAADRLTSSPTWIYDRSDRRHPAGAGYPGPEGDRSPGQGWRLVPDQYQALPHPGERHRRGGDYLCRYHASKNKGMSCAGWEPSCATRMMPITVQDFTGKILAWNRGAVQMYGWNEAEALKMNALR